MGIGTAIAIYFLIWWLMIFISLPFRMRPQLETGEVTEGTDPSAPAQPQLLRRMVWNSVLSLIVFSVYWFVVYYLDFGVDDLPEIIPIRRPDQG